PGRGDRKRLAEGANLSRDVVLYHLHRGESEIAVRLIGWRGGLVNQSLQIFAGAVTVAGVVWIAATEGARRFSRHFRHDHWRRRRRRGWGSRSEEVGEVDIDPHGLLALAVPALMEVVARTAEQLARPIDHLHVERGVAEEQVRFAGIFLAGDRRGGDLVRLIAQQPEEVRVSIETAPILPGHDERAARLVDENRRRRRLLRQQLARS